jgi:crossover junction endodeoxyribonuclease RusA
MLVRQKGFEGFGGAVLSLEMDVYPPDKRKRDIDNLIKPGIDSLMNSGLFDDDSQIARLLVVRKHIIPGGEVIVRIGEL